MAKNSKQPAAGNSARSAPQDPRAIAAEAQADLAASRFREAITGFKQLLKLEPSPPWREALAAAYAGRARELAAKGMLKEALVMWDNRAGLDAKLPPTLDHAVLLLRLGRLTPVSAMLTRAEAMAPEERERLRSLIAARAVAGDATLLESLPPEDPIRRQAETGRTLLDAYCAGEDERVRAALSEIPFRSPYRDLAQIVKALLLLPEQPEEAAKLLARLDPRSGFAPIKEAAELTLLPESAFLLAVFNTEGVKANVACALRGWPPERVAFLSDLRRLGSSPKPETLLRFLHTHRARLGEEWARRKGLRLLARHHPASLQWLRSIGAPPTTPRESLQVAGWSAELSEDPWSVFDAWSALAQHMQQEYRRGGSGDDDRLAIALVLRRADLYNEVLEEDPADSGRPPSVTTAIARQVEQSLEWDPDDRDTYLRLIHHHRARGSTKDARRLLDAANGRWPEDVRVLHATLEAAIDSGAFKKATALARRILAIDPINSGVRELLVESHLSHARKQMLKSRPDLAGKELEAAAEWAVSEHAREQLDILAGLNRLKEDAQAGVTELRAVAERLGGGLAARVALTLAGDPVRRSPALLLKPLGLSTPIVPEPRDLLAALTRLRRYLDGGNTLSSRLSDDFEKAFSKVAWTGLARPDLEAACETLRRAKLHAIRLKAARAGLKQHGNAPIFQLHAVEAKHPYGLHDTYSKDFLDLEIALKRARHEGDTRTALRIQDIIRDTISPFGPNPFGPPTFAPEPEPLPDFDADPMSAILGMIELLGLEKALDVLGVPTQLKRELKKAAREQGEESFVRYIRAVFAELEGRHSGAPRPPSPPRSTPRSPSR